MPQTPIFGIRYPCAGPPIALSDFSNFALDIEAAIATVDARENLALQRDTAAIRRNAITSPLGVAQGVVTNLTFVEENWDIGGMVDLVANNDRITIMRNGVYLFNAYVPAASGPATMTSTAVAITRNGTAIYQNKRNANSPLTSNVQTQGLYPCVIGDIIRLQFLWTGTGGPANVGCRLVARMVAET